MSARGRLGVGHHRGGAAALGRGGGAVMGGQFCSNTICGTLYTSTVILNYFKLLFLALPSVRLWG